MNEFTLNVLLRLQERFDPAALGDRAASLAADILVSAAVFAAFYACWLVADRLLGWLLRPSRVDATSASFIRTAVKVILLTIGAVQALASAGINTSAVVASLGIAGLTIGFAARDALSNIISGLLIFWDRPFVIGDLVEVGGQYGRIERITLRSTRVITSDGRMLAVPNATIINTTVASYTNYPHLRLEVPFTVGGGEDLGRVRQLLLALVAEDSAYLSEPPPTVVVKALNDYNVEMELRVWIEDERQHSTKRTELRERLFEALRAAAVDMPFETLQLAPLEVRSTNAG